MRNKTFSKRFSVRVQAAVIVMAVVLASSVFATTIGVVFSTREIGNTVETNLALLGDISSSMTISAIDKIKQDTAYVGDMMQRAYESGGMDSLVAMLESEVGQGPNFLSLGVVFPDGSLVSREKPDCDFAALSEDEIDIYRAYTSDVGLNVSDSFVAENGSQLIRNFMKFDNGLIFIGTLRGVYFSEMFYSTNYSIYGSGRVFIIDGNGVVIADSNTDAKTNALGAVFADASGEFGVIVNRVLDAGDNASGSVRYVDEFEGAGEIICTYTPIVHEPGRWVLFVTIPVSNTPIPKMRDIFVISGVIFLALGSISAFFLSAMQAKPYDELDRQNKLLAELKAEAEDAGRAKGEFLSNMSHEIRTPLNAVIGMTAIAKKARGERQKDDCLVKIEEASSHLLGVINDILDMSKIEANKLELAPEPFNFENMLRKVSEVIAFRTEEKRQNYSVDFSTDIPEYVEADEQRLAQVIANFLSNAVKFTPDNGTIKLEAKLNGKSRGGFEIEVSVTDTGIGLTKEQQSKLFQSFQQAEASTSRKFGGTGLGLAISKRIIEMMNGRIWVESEPGKGSRFAFAVVVGAATAPSEPNAFSARGLRLFAVENDGVTKANFVRSASRLGAELKIGASAADATGDFDAYFADSAGAADAIKRARPDAAVILTVEKNSSVENDDAITLAKPFFSSDMLAALAECLDADGGDADGSGTSDDEFAGRRILLAEDIEINREIVMSLLEPTGIIIDEAENGRIAVDKFAAAPDLYDIIFMDVQMPELDGYAATREIRAMDIPHAGTIPIIAMTANVFREDIDRCIEAGMNAHVGKPIDLAQVTEKLRTYLINRA
ncbi:MAG: response regulator [Oscillospiraceae bacterium]|jgi:signal transduction histidine kinase/CheY-like chemotaxis protein|nr:response regulator [Oscillospiraceae bacterium]